MPMPTLRRCASTSTSSGPSSADGVTTRRARARSPGGSRSPWPGHSSSLGADVVVPQLVARLEFVEALAETADRAGVRFLEILLDVPRGVALERFSARSQSSADPLDRLAAEHLAGMSSTAPDPADPRVDAGSAMPAGRLRAVGSDGGMVAAEPDLVGSAAPSPSDRWGTGMATYAGRLADAVAARPGTVRIDASGPLDEVYSSFVDVLRAARLSR